MGGSPVFTNTITGSNLTRFAQNTDGVVQWLESEIQQELDSGEPSSDVVTTWKRLSPPLRTAIVMTTVWIYVLARLATLSADYPDASKYIQENTGLTPIVVATAAALMARAVYNYYSGK